MKIKRWFLNNNLRNYQYLLYDKSQAIVIDPLKADDYLEFINQNGLDLTTILITHRHGDHIAGVRKLIQKFPQAKIYAYTDNELFEPNVYVKAGDNCDLGFCSFEVLFIPGHISDHVGFLFKQEKALFCGDTIFNAGVGAVKDPTADVTQLAKSVAKIIQLDDDIKLYSAHDYWEGNLNFALSILPDDEAFSHYKKIVTPLAAEEKPILTLADEKKVNIFMRSFFDEKLLEVFPESSLGEQMFIKLRHLKDNF